MQKKVIIYTDGAARGNPGPGGYGIVMRYGNQEKTFSNGYKITTNNRMELLAVIVALEHMKTFEIPVRIYTDSKYVADAIEKGWLKNWQKKDFKKTKNTDLWRRFLKIYQYFSDIQFHWVKGHANDPLNIKADKLAVDASNQTNLYIDEGYEDTSEKLF